MLFRKSNLNVYHCSKVIDIGTLADKYLAILSHISDVKCDLEQGML